MANDSAENMAWVRQHLHALMDEAVDSGAVMYRNRLGMRIVGTTPGGGTLRELTSRRTLIVRWGGD